MKDKKMPKHQKKNLVTLVWGRDALHSKLVRGVPRVNGLNINLSEGTWSLHGDTYHIGCTNRPRTDRLGEPIGIYDTTKFSHLQRLKEDVEWARTRFDHVGE